MYSSTCSYWPARRGVMKRRNGGCAIGSADAKWGVLYRLRWWDLASRKWRRAHAAGTSAIPAPTSPQMPSLEQRQQPLCSTGGEHRGLSWFEGRRRALRCFLRQGVDKLVSYYPHVCGHPSETISEGAASAEEAAENGGKGGKELQYWPGCDLGEDVITYQGTINMVNLQVFPRRPKTAIGGAGRGPGQTVEAEYSLYCDGVQTRVIQGSLNSWVKLNLGNEMKEERTK
ncbi:hypothetical protein R3P38DRAFT_2795890 [Favolaschia claudopus]|uniref:Uncharacterized protein n=1 Tax=Favolaschia claudopus TaxID=2862362 RepID=A0AAW0A5D8_9AGAR